MSTRDWAPPLFSPATASEPTTLAFTGSSPPGRLTLGYLLLVFGLVLLALRFVRRRGELG